jgi:hypothetical protein
LLDLDEPDLLLQAHFCGLSVRQRREYIEDTGDGLLQRVRWKDLAASILLVNSEEAERIYSDMLALDRGELTVDQFNASWRARDAGNRLSFGIYLWDATRHPRRRRAG